MGRKRVFSILMAMVLCLVFVGGCSTTAVQNSDAEIVLAGHRDLAPGEKDAYYVSSILKVWEPLVGVDDKGEPVPVLASKWEHSEDYKTWTFTLVKDVVFHDGTAFNGAAVVDNFERYKNMKTKSSPFYSFDVDKIYPNLDKVEALSDDSVRLSFSEPFSTLIYSMTNFGSAMYSPSCYNKENGDFTEIVKGTGPFKLIEHEAEQYALLERNEEYYGEKAKNKTFRIRVIPSAETRYAALKSDEILGVLDLGALTPALAEELIQDDRFAISTKESTINHYVHLNGNKEPFNDPKMKKAFSLIIDRDLIVKDFFYGYGTGTVNFLNQVSPFAKEVTQKHDPEKAKALANEVLKGQTMDVSFIIPQYGVDRYPYKEIVEYMQSAMKEIGLNASITILDGAAYKEAQKNGGYDLAIGTQGLPNLEPAMLFNNYMSATGASNKALNLGYNNVEVEELLKKLESTLEIEKRKEIYDRLQEISVEDPATIPILGDVNIAVYNKKLKNYDASIYGVSLEKVEWAK